MLVVVGGHSRDIGKTSVAAGIIRALPQFGWTAMKITQFGHGICGAAGRACDCSSGMEHPFSIEEEFELGNTDSGRFLKAGAKRSFWIRTAVGQLEPALPGIRKIVGSSDYTMIESNSVVQYLQPDVFLMVLDFSKEDFKASSLRLMDRVDAFVVMDTGINVPLWQHVSQGVWDSKPQFLVKPPYYVPKALSGFVRRRLIG